MKYTLQSTRYTLKNLIYLLPFAILPALFLSISTDEEAIFAVLKEVYYGRLNNWTFSDLFNSVSVFNFGSWEGVVFGFIGYIVIVPCLALIMAILEKHFRIGKKTFNGIWGKLNDNFMSTAWYALILAGIYEFWSLILAAFLFFVSRITVTAVAYVFAAIVYLAMHVLLFFLIGMIYLWLPCMQITGFRAFEALHYSYQLITPVKWRILASQMIALLSVEVLIGLCVAFVRAEFAFLIWTTLLYSFLIMTFCVRMQMVYFDRDNITRADLNKYYQK